MSGKRSKFSENFSDGPSKLHSACPFEIFENKIGKAKFFLTVLRPWVISFQPSGKSFPKGLSSLFSECPEEPFGERNLIKQFFIFSSIFGHWTIHFQPSGKKFSAGSLLRSTRPTKILRRSFLSEKTFLIAFGNRSTNYPFPKEKNWQWCQICLLRVQGNIL